MPSDTAGLFSLLQRVCPGDVAAGGARAELLAELSAELLDAGAQDAADEVARLHASLVRLIDTQFEREGGHQDWQASWLYLAILGPKNEPGAAAAALESLLGWKLHSCLHRVDSLFRPGKRSAPPTLEVQFRTDSAVPMPESEFGRIRELLEPLGVTWRYSRQAARFQVDRPSVLLAPMSAEITMLLEGKAPEWLIEAAEHNLVERVTVTFPVTTRPRTSLERIVRSVVLPRPSTAAGHPRSLREVGELLGVPNGHWKCHLVQVEHSQEWASVIIDYLRSLDGAYGRFAREGGWTASQTASVIGRHLTLSSHLELFPSELGVAETDFVSAASAIAGALEVVGNKVVPRPQLLLGSPAPNSIMARIGDFDAASLLLKGLAASMRTVGRCIAHGLALGNQPRDGDACEPDSPSTPPTAPSALREPAQLSGGLLGGSVRAEAKREIDRLWSELQQERRARVAVERDLHQLQSDCSRLRSELRRLERTQSTLSVAAARRASLVLHAFADAIDVGTQHSSHVRRARIRAERLMFGWANDSGSVGAPEESKLAATTGFVLELLRSVVAANDAKSRAELLGTYCYIVRRSDSVDDQIVPESSSHGIPRGIVEDLILSVDRCSRFAPELGVWQKHVRDLLEEGDGVPMPDEVSMQVARSALERITAFIQSERAIQVP